VQSLTGFWSMNLDDDEVCQCRNLLVIRRWGGGRQGSIEECDTVILLIYRQVALFKSNKSKHGRVKFSYTKTKTNHFHLYSSCGGIVTCMRLFSTSISLFSLN